MQGRISDAAGVAEDVRSERGHRAHLALLQEAVHLAPQGGDFSCEFPAHFSIHSVMHTYLRTFSCFIDAEPL